MGMRVDIVTLFPDVYKRQDMVINIGRLKNKEYDAVREDICAVKQAVGDKVLKLSLIPI